VRRLPWPTEDPIEPKNIASECVGKELSGIKVRSHFVHATGSSRLTAILRHVLLFVKLRTIVVYSLDEVIVVDLMALFIGGCES
jgi:hypothetical protein